MHIYLPHTQIHTSTYVFSTFAGTWRQANNGLDKHVFPDPTAALHMQKSEADQGCMELLTIHYEAHLPVFS